MKTIIVPTDFSDVANNATRYGLEMAKAIGGSAMLLNVFQVPVSITDVPVALVSVDELQDSAEKRLAEAKQEAEHITGGQVKIYTEAVLGNVVDELENICNRIPPFAVVMGTRGAAGIERVLFGSTTLSAIRHLTWPVICVPPEKQFGDGIHKIGFACDFRDVVETTPTEFIKSFVREFGAELHVLNVDYKEKHFQPDTPEQSALLHTMLEDANPRYHFISHRDIEDGLNEFSDKNQLDLLITIPKKHKLLQGLFKTSSTRQLVFHSHIPVMCIHE
ncbi:MAG TPA: universal stress protein [Chitinophagaceae bacterium]|nr:universal stress protein [Chitinophagaceae bacterium]